MCHFPVDCQSSLIKKHLVIPAITFLCKPWVALFITFASLCNGTRIKVILTGILDNLCRPVHFNIILLIQYGIPA